MTLYSGLGYASLPFADGSARPIHGYQCPSSLTPAGWAYVSSRLGNDRPHVVLGQSSAQRRWSRLRDVGKVTICVFPARSGLAVSHCT